MRVRAAVRWGVVVAAAGCLIGSPSAVHGQQATDKAANEIFGTVMSPFCPGMTLATCPSSQAAVLRDDIRAQLARGATTDEVLDELYATWGEDVLGPRSALGAGLLAWLVPALAIVIAGAGLLAWVRRSSRQDEARVPTGGGLDQAEQERLERELAQL